MGGAGAASFRPDRKLIPGLWHRTRQAGMGEPGTDGFVRSVTIEYRNDPEDWPFKTTYRAVRQIAVIHREEDLEIIDQLNEASRQADQHYNLHNP